MRKLKYTICSYIPNPSFSSDAIDFAVFVAGRSDAALVGANLSDFGEKSNHPLGQHVIDNTIEIIHGRIIEACQDPKARSGYCLLNHLVTGNLSSLVFRPIAELEDATNTAQAAMSLFTSRIGGRLATLPAETPMIIGTGWLELAQRDLRISERHLVLSANDLTDSFIAPSCV